MLTIGISASILIIVIPFVIVLGTGGQWSSTDIIQLLMTQVLLVILVLIAVMGISPEHHEKEHKRQTAGTGQPVSARYEHEVDRDDAFETPPSHRAEAHKPVPSPPSDGFDARMAKRRLREARRTIARANRIGKDTVHARSVLRMAATSLRTRHYDRCIQLADSIEEELS